MSEREKWEQYMMCSFPTANLSDLDMTWKVWQAALSTRKVYGFGVISKTEPQRLVYETQRSAEMESSYLNKHCKEGSPFRPVELFYEDQS